MEQGSCWNFQKATTGLSGMLSGMGLKITLKSPFGRHHGCSCQTELTQTAPQLQGWTYEWACYAVQAATVANFWKATSQPTCHERAYFAWSLTFDVTNFWLQSPLWGHLISRASVPGPHPSSKGLQEDDCPFQHWQQEVVLLLKVADSPNTRNGHHKNAICPLHHPRTCGLPVPVSPE